MNKRINELTRKKIRNNSSKCLNRWKSELIIANYPEMIWYKKSDNEEVDLLTEDFFIKKQNTKRNLIEN